MAIDAGFELVEGHVIGDPRPAAGLQVGHHRLDAVERFGKAGVGCFGGFEFVPEGAELLRDVGGKKPEDAVGGAPFGGLRCIAGMGLPIRRMDRHIAHVDFDQVMDQQHADHAVDLHARPGLIGQNHRVKRQMPGMFARIFRPRPVAERGGAQHGFQAVRFVQKGELRRQPVRYRPVRLGGHVSATLHPGGGARNPTPFRSSASYAPLHP